MSHSLNAGRLNFHRASGADSAQHVAPKCHRWQCRLRQTGAGPRPLL